MATRVIAPVALPAGPVVRAWPQSVSWITIALDVTEFTQVGTEIELVVELSFDGQASWPLLFRSTMAEGGRTRFGDAPFVEYKRTWLIGGVAMESTHVRARMARVSASGSPRVGLIVGFDGDRSVG